LPIDPQLRYISSVLFDIDLEMYMSTAAHSLLALFDSLESKIADRDAFARNSISALAEDVVSWSKTIDLNDLESSPAKIFSQIMTLVSAGMTGDSLDAERAVRSLRASLPMLKSGLKKAIRKQK
jgi:hypothetical protein